MSSEVLTNPDQQDDEPQSNQPDHDPPANTSGWLSNRVMGGAFLVLAFVLVGGQLYTITQVIAPLTRPPKFSEKLIESAIKRDLDQSEAAFYVSLEYTAAQIRAINSQIAIASVGGFFLIVVGMLLFATGAVRPFTVEAKDSGSQSLTLTDVAPGVFTALLGAVIMAIGILRPMTRTEITFEERRPARSASDNRSQASISITPLPEGIEADYDENNTQAGDSNLP